ncbi:MAG: peptidyl-prolyl cis-trans isomerase [Spirochaetaceae bacterium]|jgi:parvulin-like peptidyl-prolyl isomerase|nr:peptidyl-prolyl cis-trans isomerase [Spirochaetaceae bacterium]
MKKRALFFMIFYSGAAFLFAGDMDTVATVKLIKTEPITVKQLRTEIELIEKITGQKVSSLEDRKKVLVDKMIPERLVLQAAERDKVYADEKAIDQQMNQLRAAVSSQLNRQITDADFAEAVRQQMGMDVPSYRAELKRQYIIQRYVYKYAQEKKAGLIQSIKEPTEAEIIDYYNLNKAKAVRPDTVRLTMIQIPFDNDKAKARETGNNLAKEIGGSAVKFDQVSVRAGGASGYRVGDPGPIPRNPEAQQLFGSDFMNTVFGMKLGDVSRLIETPNAYYIVKVIDIYEQRSLSLDDEIQPGNATTMREYIKAGLLQEKQQAVLKTIQDELVAELSKGNPYSVNDKYISF